jgi:hypothetical protein
MKPMNLRKCPRCGGPIARYRLWGLSWSAAPWPCGGCDAMLGVDMDRRSNLTFVSTVFVCGLLATCFAWTWYAALLAVPGFVAIWSLDRAVVAPASDPL